MPVKPLGIYTINPSNGNTQLYLYWLKHTAPSGRSRGVLGMPPFSRSQTKTKLFCNNTAGHMVSCYTCRTNCSEAHVAQAHRWGRLTNETHLHFWLGQSGVICQPRKARPRKLPNSNQWKTVTIKAGLLQEAAHTEVWVYKARPKAGFNQMRVWS